MNRYSDYFKNNVHIKIKNKKDKSTFNTVCK